MAERDYEYRIPETKEYQEEVDILFSCRQP